MSLLTRRRLASRWRSVVAIAVLLGVSSGIAMFAVAGARRTQSAYPRMLREVAASTLTITSAGDFDAGRNAALAGLPEVVQSRTYVGFNVVALAADGRPDPSFAWEAMGTFDGRYFDQDRFTPTSGRAADPTAIDEVVLNEYGARRLALNVGDELPLGIYSSEEAFAPTFLTDPPTPRGVVTATIVGIGLFPDEVLQDDADRTARLLLTPAYSEQQRSLATYSLQGLILRGGDDDIPAVKRRIAELTTPGTVEFRVTSVDTFHAQQAIRPIALALALFGAIVGLAGLAMAGQAVTRLVRDDDGDHAALHAFGIGRATLALSDAVLAGLAVVVGALLGVVAAIGASPLAPVGPVRRIEVAGGIDVDIVVLGVGAAALLTVLGAAVAVAAWRGAGTVHADTGSVLRISRWCTTATTVLPAPASAGVHLTFGAGHRHGVPARSVIVGAIVGVASLVIALTFSTSLDLLVKRPDLYGWNWDVVVSAANGFGNIDRAAATDALASDPGVEAWSGAWYGSDLIDGREVPLLGVEPASDVLPPVISGRPISDPSEVVLGAATAADLGAGIGDQVVLGDGAGATLLEVVGLATFPALGPVHVARTSLGVGALVDRQLVPGSDLDMTTSQRGDFGPNILLVRFRDGIDDEAARTSLRTAVGPLGTFAGIDVLEVQRPAEIVNSEAVTGAPLVLGAALLVGALVSLAVAIGTFVRQRRHDLAVLRTMGFTRSQVRAMVLWQAVLLVTPGVLIGVPLGALLGKLLWDDFAERMDAIAAPLVPAFAVAGVAGATYLAALAAAAVHARRAGGIDAARLLRAE